MRRATLIAAVFLLIVAGGLGVPSAMATTVFDGMVSQADIDGSASSNPGWTSGGWADATGGVGGRPYIKNLSVTNGDTTTAVISGGSAGAVPTPIGGSDLTAIVTPINVCKPGGSRTAIPARIGCRSRSSTCREAPTTTTCRGEAGAPSRP